MEVEAAALLECWLGEAVRVYELEEETEVEAEGLARGCLGMTRKKGGEE